VSKYTSCFSLGVICPATALCSRTIPWRRMGSEDGDEHIGKTVLGAGKYYSRVTPLWDQLIGDLFDPRDGLDVLRTVTAALAGNRHSIATSQRGALISDQFLTLLLLLLLLLIYSPFVRSW
jgi:hypothetical protein